jgi:hypothetical protein
VLGPLVADDGLDPQGKFLSAAAADVAENPLELEAAYLWAEPVL